MENSRAWTVGALTVLGTVVLVAFGSGHRDDYGRVRAAVGAQGDTAADGGTACVGAPRAGAADGVVPGPVVPTQ